jgi:exonuclease VII large subunit
MAEGALIRSWKALGLFDSRMSIEKVFPFRETVMALSKTRLSLPVFVQRTLSDSERALSRTMALLREANPEAPLSRGYFMLTRRLGGRVVSLDNIPENGEHVLARTAHLSLVLQVEEVRQEREGG